MDKETEKIYYEQLAKKAAQDKARWAIEQAAVIAGGLGQIPSAESVRDTAKVVLEARDMLEKEMLAAIQTEKNEGEK